MYVVRDAVVAAAVAGADEFELDPFRWSITTQAITPAATASASTVPIRRTRPPRRVPPAVSSTPSPEAGPSPFASLPPGCSGPAGASGSRPITSHPMRSSAIDVLAARSVRRRPPMIPLEDWNWALERHVARIGWAAASRSYQATPRDRFRLPAWTFLYSPERGHRRKTAGREMGGNSDLWGRTPPVRDAARGWGATEAEAQAAAQLPRLPRTPRQGRYGPRSEVAPRAVHQG